MTETRLARISAKMSVVLRKLELTFFAYIIIVALLYKYLFVTRTDMKQQNQINNKKVNDQTSDKYLSKKSEEN